MTQRVPRTRHTLYLAGGLAACATFAIATVDTAQARRSNTKIAHTLTATVRTPLGLQGTAGSGERTVLPFVIADRSGRRVDVDVEYGIDLDGDGVISDGTVDGKPSEYQRATHHRRDTRDTSRLKVKANGKTSITYRPARAGASHAYVWNNLADLGRANVRNGSQILRDETGRVLLDPFDRTQPRFTDELPGIVLRLRAVRRGGKRQQTDWVYTDAFSVDNSLAPVATVDGIGAIDTSSGVADLLWTVYDDDSEDRNGNGLLDVLDFEDQNGNGQLDAAPVAVAFDHYRLADGESVPTSASALAALDWQPSTRAAGLGDSDIGVPSAPDGVGREATFAWDFHADLGGARFSAGRYLVRATPFDELGNVGQAAYLGEVLVIDPVDE